MRHLLHATLGVLLVVASGHEFVAAEESGSWWWPFGRGDQAEAVTPAPQPERTTWLPRPQLLPGSGLLGGGDEDGEQRNTWAQKRPVPSQDPPWVVVGNRFRRAGERTRSAWRRSIDAVTPGGESEVRVAQREPRQSLWSRMFGGEEPEPQGPRTVTEWMAQERLNP